MATTYIYPASGVQLTPDDQIRLRAYIERVGRQGAADSIGVCWATLARAARGEGIQRATRAIILRALGVGAREAA